jgi:hypothetical protein
MSGLRCTICLQKCINHLKNKETPMKKWIRVLLAAVPAWLILVTPNAGATAIYGGTAFAQPHTTVDTSGSCSSYPCSYEYTVTAGADYAPLKAFDGAAATFWMAGGVMGTTCVNYTCSSGMRRWDTTGIIGYTYPTYVAVNEYHLMPSHVVGNAPKNWTFEGWDGMKWVVLDQRVNYVSWTAYTKSVFTLPVTGSYLQYRLNISANSGGARLQLAEFELHSLKPATNYVPWLRYDSWDLKNRDVFHSSIFMDPQAVSRRYRVDGLEGYIWTANQPGSVPLYRYYNRSSFMIKDDGDHFYTTNFNEFGSGKNGYAYEGIVGYVYNYPKAGTVAFRRFFNGRAYFFTSATGSVSIYTEQPTNIWISLTNQPD